MQREPLTLDDPNALQLMPTQTPPPPFAPTRPHMRRFDECNLTVDVPGNPWAERDPKLVSGETLLHVVRTDPFIVVLLGCEAKGVEQKLDNRSLVSLSQVRLRAVASDATITPTEAASAHGIDGLRYTSTRTMAGHGVYCVHWVAMSNGYAYSLVAVGTRADSALVDDAHRDFLNRLKRIDATKIRTPRARNLSTDLIGRLRLPRRRQEHGVGRGAGKRRQLNWSKTSRQARTVRADRDPYTDASSHA